MAIREIVKKIDLRKLTLHLVILFLQETHWARVICTLLHIRVLQSIDFFDNFAEVILLLLLFLKLLVNSHQKFINNQDMVRVPICDILPRDII